MSGQLVIRVMISLMLARRTLAEYKRRFGLLLDNDDESGIPSDLRSSIYSQSVKHGGEKEYLKVSFPPSFVIPLC